jgi:hypothetical protein
MTQTLTDTLRLYLETQTELQTLEQKSSSTKQKLHILSQNLCEIIAKDRIGQDPKDYEITAYIQLDKDFYLLQAKQAYEPYATGRRVQLEAADDWTVTLEKIPMIKLN